MRINKIDEIGKKIEEILIQRARSGKFGITQKCLAKEAKVFEYNLVNIRDELKRRGYCDFEVAGRNVVYWLPKTKLLEILKQ
jgi:DNA-binding Lrp family transcriptional regulator